MSFIIRLEQAQEMLKKHGRLSARAIGRELEVEGEELNDLIEELVNIQQLAKREGKALVWLNDDVASPAVVNAKNVHSKTPQYIADKILASRAAMEGEKKQVTVLFCDIVGSMDLAEALGPENWHYCVKDFFNVLTQTVHEFDGMVCQYTGDGIMALFGAPIADEDHARQACMSALKINKNLELIQERINLDHNLNFAVRIGINTGEVVVGQISDDLSMSYTSISHTVGIASRMESMASAGNTMLSTYTAHQVKGYFELVPLGKHDIKGIKEPFDIYKLGPAKLDATRLDIARKHGLSKFVGRESEVKVLQDALVQHQRGHGQVVCIVAEAGTGKSRLCWEFKQQCLRQGVTVHSTYGTALENQRSYESIKRLCRSIYNINEVGLSHEEARQRISTRLLALDKRAANALPGLYAFLGVEDEKNPAPPIPPELQRQVYLDFTRWSFKLIGSNEPMVIILDDLHWFDEASVGVLKVILEIVDETSTMVVVNYRPELKFDISSTAPYLHRLYLKPLSAAAIKELVYDLLGDHPSLTGLPQKLIKTSGGNPFYAEEIIRDLIDNRQLVRQGRHYRYIGHEQLPLPVSLHNLLASRIDRLPLSDKEILQTAAVIGRSFEIELLAQISGQSIKDISASLRRLEKANFVTENMQNSGSIWLMKHALTEEVVYNSLLDSKRRELHARVAQAIEERSGKNLTDQASIVAYHWESAGQFPKAAKAAHKAARWTHKRDLRESLRHRKEVLRLLDGVSETPELLHIGVAARRELVQWAMISGIDPATAEDHFNQGCTIAENTGDFITLGTLIGAFSLLECQRARFTEAIALADKCKTLLGKVKHAEIQATTDGVIFGTAYGSAGRVIEARESTARALALTNTDPNLGAVAAFNIRMWSGALHGMTQGASGQPVEAIAELEQLSPQAFKEQETGAALIVGFTNWLRMYTGDTTDRFDQCEKSLRFAKRLGIGYWQGAAHTYYGIALITHRRWREAQRHLETVLNLNQHNHFMEYYNTLASVHLPLVLLMNGDGEKALRMNQKARELADASNSFFFRNDHFWVTSQLLRQTPDTAAFEELEDNLQLWQQCIDESGMELCRHLWWWETAKVAQLQGDATGYRLSLEKALSAAEACSAAGNAEAIRTELAA